MAPKYSKRGYQPLSNSAHTWDMEAFVSGCSFGHSGSAAPIKALVVYCNRTTLQNCWDPSLHFSDSDAQAWLCPESTHFGDDPLRASLTHRYATCLEASLT